MKKKFDPSKSRFKKAVRIDPKQLEYLRGNKGKCRTIAGFLDKIINLYKKHKKNEDTKSLQK